ncbi:MAG: GlsB/YeaQ/YmgE family stress response membrane protein [Gammaproteobacteria bacterium]|nr:GlsB/YeaQ/YmgE family stress response membrane protein [Gammaproteobacteria bacterium]MCB1924182.1 GlsB/YeaQ/YmgE family stress response membrane protein [Gammaproteobacteria bacterium]
MPLWVLIIWLVIGVAAGLLAPKIMGGQTSGNALGDLVMGIVGALLGGYGLSLVLPDALRGAVGGLIVTVLVAVVGALALIWIARRLKKSA